jgi:hypothetical protein
VDDVPLPVLGEGADVVPGSCGEVLLLGEAVGAGPPAPSVTVTTVFPWRFSYGTANASPTSSEDASKAKLEIVEERIIVEVAEFVICVRKLKRRLGK